MRDTQQDTTQPRRGGRRGKSAATSLGALALLVFLLALGGCGSSSQPPASSQQPPAATTAVPLTLPPQLAGYHIFVTDLLTGNVAELGQRTVHVASSVHGLGLSDDGQTLYVTDINGDRVEAYALAGGVIASTAAHGAAVGAQPVHMVATPDGSRIFVTNFGGQTVSVIATATWTSVASITVPAKPHAIVLSPDGRLAYAACYGGAAVAVIDTASATLTATIPLPAHAEPYGLAISRDGRYLYTSDNLNNRLDVLDSTTRQVVASVALGERPALIARSADGATLYVTNGASHSVSVFDLAHDPAHPASRATINVDGYPHGLALTPDGRYLIVANTLGKDLSVIATASDTVIATIPAERFPNDVVIAG